MIHFFTPYRSDKNLGRAYNDAMSMIGDNDTACLRDIDTLFLTPEQPSVIERYAEKYPDAVLTCYTNRVSQLSRQQLLGGQVSEEGEIRKHIEAAEQVQERFASTLSVGEISRDISGMLMVVPKKIWKAHPFPEDGKCLGVDTQFGRTIRAAGIKILRMDAVYIFHTYRMAKGVHDKAHLV